LNCGKEFQFEIVAHPKQRTLKGLAGQTSLLDKDEAAN
jgi:hypothetical protein